MAFLTVRNRLIKILRAQGQLIGHKQKKKTINYAHQNTYNYTQCNSYSPCVSRKGILALAQVDMVEKARRGTTTSSKYGCHRCAVRRGNLRQFVFTTCATLENTSRKQNDG